MGAGACVGNAKSGANTNEESKQSLLKNQPNFNPVDIVDNKIAMNPTTSTGNNNSPNNNTKTILKDSPNPTNKDVKGTVPKFQKVENNLEHFIHDAVLFGSRVDAVKKVNHFIIKLSIITQ